MAKAKIVAGGNFETLTQPEVRVELTRAAVEWRKELARADIYRQISGAATVDAAGGLRIGGSDTADGLLGPRAGMLWAVNRLAITNALGTPILRWYRNAPDASSFVRGGPALTNGDGYFAFGANDLVLGSEDSILVVGTGLTAATVVTITGQAREVPATMGWRLGGS